MRTIEPRSTVWRRGVRQKNETPLLLPPQTVERGSTVRAL